MTVKQMSFDLEMVNYIFQDRISVMGWCISVNKTCSFTSAEKEISRNGSLSRIIRPRSVHASFSLIYIHWQDDSWLSYDTREKRAVECRLTVRTAFSPLKM